MLATDSWWIMLNKLSAVQECDPSLRQAQDKLPRNCSIK